MLSMFFVNGTQKFEFLTLKNVLIRKFALSKATNRLRVPIINYSYYFITKERYSAVDKAVGVFGNH